MIGTAYAASMVLASTATLATIRARVEPYFLPAPGKTVAIDEQEIKNLRNGSPLDLRGYITVAPKPGECLTIQVNLDRPDIVVCKKTRVPFLARDLDLAGRVVWQVSRPGDPIPVDLSWPTPHRFANYIPGGERLEALSKLQFVLKCEAVVGPMTRRITLELPHNKIWIIHFPEHDTLVGQPPPPPNLYYNGGVDMGGIQTTSKAAADQTTDFERAKEKAKEKESVQTYWAISPRGAYYMSSSNFSSTDAPGGLKGECRYRLQGSAEDPDSGIIECHNTDSFDVVKVNLPCAKDLITP